MVKIRADDPGVPDEPRLLPDRELPAEESAGQRAFDHVRSILARRGEDSA